MKRRRGYPTIDIDWTNTRYNRTALVNAAMSLTGARRYLEIGCASNENFDAVPLLDKIGVDPVSGGTHRMTSDAFFEDNQDEFDLVFIDGLHTYSQARRDILNALDCLSPGGFVLVHDSLPVSWHEQAVPRMQSYWTGDVWKAVFEIKTRDDIDLRVALIDHGCAIIVKRPSTDPVEFHVDDYSEIEFDFYLDNRSKLGLLSFQDAVSFIRESVKST